MTAELLRYDPMAALIELLEDVSGHVDEFEVDYAAIGGKKSSVLVGGRGSKFGSYMWS